jgi:crotonobetainyl-CoA:carnitine CoA-transferase CaiB-like acyl-CoA transferase
MAAGALTGIRVLDLGRLLAAPTAAQILGDLGADVIKIERPDGGDMSRFAGPSFLIDEQGRPTNESSLYLSCNRNKRSVTVSLGSSRPTAAS